MGIGFAILIFFARTPLAQRQLLQQASLPLLFSSVVMMGAWVAGIRIVFSMPLALPSNWIFRVTQVRGAREYLAAIRRPLFVLTVAPVWAVTAALTLATWPWRAAAAHLLVLALWGTILAWLCLHGFQKIPFTCSYLPGKTYIHIAFLISLMLLRFILNGVEFEQRALSNPFDYWRMVAVLCVAALLARWRTMAAAKSEEASLQFEDVAPPAVQVLGLFRDGMLPSEPASRPPGDSGSNQISTS